MIISPTLLDFLEQALEPLPVNQSSSSILKRGMCRQLDEAICTLDLLLWIFFSRVITFLQYF